MARAQSPDGSIQSLGTRPEGGSILDTAKERHAKSDGSWGIRRYRLVRVRVDSLQGILLATSVWCLLQVKSARVNDKCVHFNWFVWKRLSSSHSSAS
jgi:hypothetical protein